MGKLDNKKASEVFSQTMVTLSVVCIAASIVVFTLFTPILSVLRADGELSVYFNGYYKIMLFTYPLMVVSTILGMFIRTDGYPQVCMIVNIIGCILNAVLDYIFVGVLCMGVEGSAVNSVINKAIDFIFDNIDNDITVDDVARHCSYSKYHLMRMFKEHTNEALYQFIKRTRIERSAWKLKVERDKSTSEIGVDYGYSSSNYATAFKKHLNDTPANFRNISEQLAEQCSFSHCISMDDLEKTENLITVEELDDFFVLYERKKGNYNNLPEEWCAFINKYQHLSSADTLYLESTIDDPSITDENCCMYEMCQTISPNHPALKDNPHIMTHTFAGGKYAVYHFKGYPQMLYMVYQGVFCRWLSKTGNRIDERPVFDIYRKVEENG